MTVSTTGNRAEYSLTDTTASFAFASGGVNFTIFDDDDLKVYVDGVLKTKTTHYTVTINTSNEATVTFVSSPSDYRPVSGQEVILVREVPLTQTTNYQNNNIFDAETLEKSIDLETMKAQQLSTEALRSIKFADDVIGVTSSVTEITTAGTARANKILGFDASGNISATLELGTNRGNWATSTAYVVRDLVKQNNSADSGTYGNIYLCITAHTSTGAHVTASDSANWQLIVDTATATTSATASASSATTSTAQAALSSDHRADAGKYAVTAEDSTFSLTATNGGTSGLYSAKHYQAKALANQTASASSATASAASATASSASEVAAKNSAAAVANSFDLFDDTYLGAMKDPFVFTASESAGLLLTHAAHGLLDGNIVQVASATTLPTGLSATTNYYVVNKTTNNFKLALASSGTPIAWTDAGSGVHTWVYGSPTTNGTWTKDSATITVVSNVGIRVGQKVSGTGIPAPTDSPANPIPNVLSIDGTAVVISQNMPAAGSAVATTFSSLGINGPYNTSTDGPSTNNDGEALASGNLFFNSSDNEMRIYDGGNWIAATSAGTTSLLIYKYVATGSQTTFTGSDANGATLSYVANNINVYLNGVRLDATDYTASNGTSVVLGSGATASDELVVVAFKSFSTADMVPASTGGTFSANVSMATNTKLLQKGAFMHHSSHQAWVLGG